MVDLFRNQKWDLVSKRGLYYVISAVILFIGLWALFARGLNLGIDFKGGGLVTYRIQGHLTETQASDVIKTLRDDELKQAGITAEVQVSPETAASSGDVIIVRTLLPEQGGAEATEHEQVLNQQIVNTITPAVARVVTQILPESGTPTIESTEVVSQTVSDELVRNAVVAVIFGSLLILGWIWLRYNIGGLGGRYASAAIIALLHDLLTLIGMFALFRDHLQVNAPFIAALLTVLGFSIHDTIIIFDRIRENIKLRKGRTFAETVNISLLETMARSVNTVLTVLFTLLALFFFGGPTLRDFTAAMLIGVLVGTYSSIFVASQLLVSWSKGRDREMVAFTTSDDVTGPTTIATATTATAQPMIAGTSAPAPASREALQRARQAGKTAKRPR